MTTRIPNANPGAFGKRHPHPRNGDTMTITELYNRIERLSHAVRKLAGWSGNDIADLIEDGLIKEGDLS